jgi:hypothetical protein
VRLTTLAGYNVDVLPVPPQLGGGRSLVIQANDGTEQLTLMLDDDTAKILADKLGAPSIVVPPRVLQ